MKVNLWAVFAILAVIVSVFLFTRPEYWAYKQEALAARMRMYEKVFA